MMPRLALSSSSEVTLLPQPPHVANAAASYWPICPSCYSNLSHFLLFVSGVQLDVAPQSLNPEVLLKLKSEIEEELKSLDKEVAEGLFTLTSRQ